MLPKYLTLRRKPILNENKIIGFSLYALPHAEVLRIIIVIIIIIIEDALQSAARIRCFLAFGGRVYIGV